MSAPARKSEPPPDPTAPPPAEPPQPTSTAPLFAIPDWVDVNDPKRLLQAKQEREREARRRVIGQLATTRVHDQIPKTYRGTPQELFTTRKIHPRLLRAVKGLTRPTLSALLIGPTRTGKTTMAAALVRMAINEYVSSLGERYQEIPWLRWVKAPQLSLSERRHSLGSGAPSPVVDAIGARCVVLDDIGWETDTGPVVEVIRERYDAGLPTIVTTGLTPEQLEAKFEAAIISRLRDQPATGYPMLLVDLFEVKASK